MANTTNFGWETPDDTDLVKDGALAMRTLGNAIDASLVDLKGGTTGQVLSKNTNTDMDFVWTTPQTGDITAVTAGTGLSGGGTSGDVTLTNTVATTFDAKGDLVVGTGADTFAKLVAGSNGDTLVADSSATTGLRWSGATTQNPVINSAFDIWQRGTSIAGSSGSYQYTADRWQMNNVTAFTISRQATGDTTNLPFIQFCGRVARNSGSTSTSLNIIYNSFETANSIPFVGRTVTLSFYARRGANFSASGNNLTALLVTGTGTDQSAMTGFTNQADVINQNATLTTTWQRFTYTGTVPTNSNQLAIGFFYTPTGTAGAADFFEVTGVQLDVGAVSLPFRRSAATLAGELAACQRYYQVHSRNEVWQMAQATSTSAAHLGVSLIAQMRVAPTITLAGAGSSNTTMSLLTSSGNYPTTIGSFTARSITTVGFHLNATGFTGAFTAGNASAIYAGGEINVYTASAEL